MRRQSTYFKITAKPSASFKPPNQTLPSSTATKRTLASCTGQVSPLESSLGIKCHPSPSSQAAVGVKCLEEAYSSLVEGFLL
jgi:hypothetical protein